MRLDPSHDKRLHELRELSKEYARAKADESYLEHFRKSKLAILTKEIFADGKHSHASAENEARTKKEYLDVLSALRDATERSAKAYWELRIAEAGIGLLRSKMASERVEAGLT